MTDEDFKRACNTFGFAPSRALRELLDTVTAQEVIAEREACASVVQHFSSEASAAWQEDQFTERAMRSGLLAMFGVVTEGCAAAIRARGQA